MQYWVKRNLKTQKELSNKSIKEIEKQLERYYSKTAQRIMREFENTYEHLIYSVQSGREPTPADLYKLDSYWKMVAQTQKELNKLGNYQSNLFFKRFTDTYIGVYSSLAIGSQAEYATIDRKTAEQMIKQIWCADGKNWSSRVWKNTERLQLALNDRLIECVVGGKKTTDLKQYLQAEFNVSYKQADSIVRTEIAHIQTQACRDRYISYGIQEVEIWADKDERRCDVCGKLHKKRLPIGATIPIPAHPNCRCCVIPVIE